jgi:hypothetical protein
MDQNPGVHPYQPAATPSGNPGLSPNFRTTEPLRKAGQTPIRPGTGTGNPAITDYKKLGAENDAAILRELRLIATAMMAFLLLAMLVVGIEVTAAFYFYHAITRGAGIGTGGAG